MQQSWWHRTGAWSTRMEWGYPVECRLRRLSELPIAKIAGNTEAYRRATWRGTSDVINSPPENRHIV